MKISKTNKIIRKNVFRYAETSGSVHCTEPKNISPNSKSVSKNINPVFIKPVNSRSELTNTHYYDGKLTEAIIISPNISKLNKINIIQDLKTLLETESNHPLYYGAMAALKIIQADINNPENYDATNNLRADNILYLLVKKLETNIDKSLKSVILEQLSDIISSGSCPQGRCTRLYQIYISL